MTNTTTTTAAPSLTPWHATPLWLRALQCDVALYMPDALPMVRMARSGCPVSLANCRTLHERVMGRA